MLYYVVAFGGRSAAAIEPRAQAIIPFWTLADRTPNSIYPIFQSKAPYGNAGPNQYLFSAM